MGYIENMEPSVVTYPLPTTVLHGIVGVMDTFIGSMEAAKTANFGGYFKEHAEDHTFQGQLIDPHGPATITGTISNDHLKFTKKYESGPSLDAEILYHYQKSANGFWIGTYNFKLGDKNITGNSTCDIYTIVLDPENTPLLETTK